MTMTNYEFAKLLLSQPEEKPLYLQENYEHMGEHSTGYSDITGVDDSIVENGYVIKYDFLKAEPNDKKYHKGDCLVFIEDDENNKKQIARTLELRMDDIVYMLFSKQSHYFNYNIDKIGFPEYTEEENITLLKRTIKVSTTFGFHPEWKEMAIEDAIIWYREQFKEYLTDQEL